MKNIFVFLVEITFQMSNHEQIDSEAASGGVYKSRR